MLPKVEADCQGEEGAEPEDEPLDRLVEHSSVVVTKRVFFAATS